MWAPFKNSAGRRLDGLRRERAEAEKQLAEVRERANRLEIEEAEIRVRLEQAIERVRHEFDCEPDAALAAPVVDPALRPRLAPGQRPRQ